MASTKLIPPEKKEDFQLFSLEGNSPSAIIESLTLDFLDKSDKKYGKVKDVHTKDKIRKEMYKFIVEFFCKKETLPLKEFIMTLEKCIILRALSKFNGNQKEAAKFLGIKYTTLNEKIKKYRIDFRKNPYFVSGFLS
jgi:DNA-binding NtrC family response regulator